jgi:hypothetical protein
VLGKARVFYGIVKKEKTINIRDLQAALKGQDRRYINPLSCQCGIAFNPG